MSKDDWITQKHINVFRKLLDQQQSEERDQLAKLIRESDQPRDARLPYDEERRERGVYIIGNQGCGKSTLALRMMLHDIKQGGGLCLIDPKGTAASKLMTLLPENRLNDYIFFDGNDPFPINIFQATDDYEARSLAGHVASFFKATSQTFGDAMKAVLTQATRALVRKPNPVFLDLFKILSDEGWREKHILPFIKDDEDLHAFWASTYKKDYEKETTVRALKTRIIQFQTPLMKALLGSSASAINFTDLMDSRKVLIVDVSNLDPDTLELMGLLFVSQFKIAALRRGKKRKPYAPFYLYVDEFQYFNGCPFEEIINVAREFRLCLTLINQHIYNLEPAVRQQNVLAMATKIMFQTSVDDAPKLKKFFPKVEKDERGRVISHQVDDLLSLPRFVAFSHYESELRKFKARDDLTVTNDLTQRIKDQTRKRYHDPYKPSGKSDASSQAPEAAVESYQPTDDFSSPDPTT